MGLAVSMPPSGVDAAVDAQPVVGRTEPVALAVDARDRPDELCGAQNGQLPIRGVGQCPSGGTDQSCPLWLLGWRGFAVDNDVPGSRQ
jgi:hypothetical protein